MSDRRRFFGVTYDNSREEWELSDASAMVASISKEFGSVLPLFGAFFFMNLPPFPRGDDSIFKIFKWVKPVVIKTYAL